jgi:hypothetical protein
LVLLLKHLELVLLFLKAFLDDFGACDDALLHLLHDVSLDLDGEVKRVDCVVGV